MRYSAEYVGSGHPDRLADKIVADIVDYVYSEDNRGLCGLECAVSTNKVYITGRIAAGEKKCVIDKKKVIQIVKEVYDSAKYNKKGFEPCCDKLKIYTDICFDTLSKEERKLRSFSDDQSICVGYACNSEYTCLVPVEQFIAHRIGNDLEEDIISYSKFKDFGCDFKVLVELNEENNIYTYNKITVSALHKKGVEYKELCDIITENIVSYINNLYFQSKEFINLTNIDRKLIYFNGAGDFHVGGPMGDNGLSGKKLVVDFYGPRVEIGGGAIWGKDRHKVDVCGSYAAREIAVELVKKYKYKEVVVKIAYSPGESMPDYIECTYTDSLGMKGIVNNNLLNDLSYYEIDKICNRMDDYYLRSVQVQYNRYMSMSNIYDV